MSVYIDLVKAKIRIKNYGKQAIDSGIQALDPVDDILEIVNILDRIPTIDAQEIHRSHVHLQGDMNGKNS